ncbi:hypothetical protein ACO0QE_001080 [Hanseniaspora vineae]
MSEDHSLATFITRNRTAIITTVAAATTVIGAGYYYYNNVAGKSYDGSDDDSVSSSKSSSSSPSSSAPSSSNSAASKKKKKKQQYKQKKKLEKQTENAAISGTLEEQAVGVASTESSKDKSSGTQDEIVDLAKLGVPLTSSGEIDMAQITTEEEKDKITMKLKEQGNVYFKNKQYENAIKLYTTALDIKKDPVFLSNRSACYVSLGEYEKVVEDCSAALELKRDYSKCLLRRASAYEILGNYSDSMFDISALSLLGDFNGESIETMLERVLNKQIQKISEEKIKDAANKTHELSSFSDLASFFSSLSSNHKLKHYNSEDEDDVLLSKTIDDLYSQNAKGLSNANEKFPECVSRFEKKLAESPNDEILKEKLAIALSYQGILYFFKADPTSANTVLEKSLELFPTVNAYVFFALLKSEKGTSEEVFGNFTKAIELDPKDPAPYYHRAQLYFVTNDLEKAGADFEKAKEIDPNHVFSYIQIACLTYKEGSLTDAETLFSEALRKFPDNSDIYVSYAEVLADSKHYEKSIKNLDKAIELEEKAGSDNVSANALITKANILASNPTVENFVEASKLLEKANEKSPRNFKAKISLGQFKLQEGDLDEALKLFEDSIDLAMSMEDKYIAIKLHEGVKTQLRLKQDPYMSQKIDELLAQYAMGP